VTLIQRTTRKLHVTPIGLSYFKKCLEGLDDIREAEAEILTYQGEPQGQLRITAPVELGLSLLSPIISQYLRKYPQVGIDVVLSDRRVDLLSEGIDLAIRAGELKDSSLISKKLGSVYFAPFASPKYLKANGTPLNTKDLSQHKLIEFSQISDGYWNLVRDSKLIKIPTPRKMNINDLRLVNELAIDGNGIALLPTFFCYEAVQSGKLVRVLPQWISQKNPVQFVYPAQKFVTPKLSAFITLSADIIKENLQAFEI
jgi:DNA-binding transcriptional LysR family regulator